MQPYKDMIFRKATRQWVVKKVSSGRTPPAAVRGACDMKNFSSISEINEKLFEWGVLGVLFQGNKHDIIHRDGETMSVKSTLTQTNSQNHMLTDILLDETPHIDSDYKNIFPVFTTEVFLGKKNGVYVSVLAQHRHHIR